MAELSKIFYSGLKNKKERPKKTMDDNKTARNVNIRKNAMDELSKIFYTGLKDKGKF